MKRRTDKGLIILLLCVTAFFFYYGGRYQGKDIGIEQGKAEVRANRVPLSSDLHTLPQEFSYRVTSLPDGGFETQWSAPEDTFMVDKWIVAENKELRDKLAVGSAAIEAAAGKVFETTRIKNEYKYELSRCREWVDGLGADLVEARSIIRSMR